MPTTVNSLTPEQRQTKLNAWLDFWKFFLGSVVVALITAWLAHLLKERELDLKTIEQNSHIALEEGKQLGSFLDKALVDNIDAQIRFAEYFSFLTREDQSRKRWSDYCAALKTKINKPAELTEKARANDVELRQPNLTDEKRVALEAEKQKLAEEKAQAVARLQALDSSPIARLSVFVEGDEQLANVKALFSGVTISRMSNGKVTISKIHRFNDDTRPRKPEVSYFLLADEALAAEVANLAQRILKVDSVLITKKDDDSITRSGYLELWIPLKTLAGDVQK